MVLAWWLIPLTATALAVAWVMLRSRPPKETDPQDAMSQLDGFRRAMERPLPPERRTGRPGVARGPRSGDAGRS